MNLMTAVPAAVSCAVPITAEFTQNTAAASQNVTVPSVTGEPFDTDAVSVTTVPDATDPEDRTRVVVVGNPGIPACAGDTNRIIAINIIAARNIVKRVFRFFDERVADMSWAPAEIRLMAKYRARKNCLKGGNNLTRGK